VLRLLALFDADALIPAGHRMRDEKPFVERR
jgi:hypothetical protein